MTVNEQVSNTSINDFMIVARDEDGIVVTNVPKRIVRHSPTGFEFGYAGSGPSDLALNLTIQSLIQLRIIDEFDPKNVPAEAERIYQDVKERFIVGIPDQGARIPMKDVVDFVREKLRESGDLPPDEPSVLEPA